jgi:glyoxylate/hydroxypyruvate reductase A
VVINPARGGHVVDDDLIAALDSGHLDGATLDVFRTEPLPADHPFWSHGKITVTPHIAAWSLPRTAAKTVCDNIRRHRAGEALLHMVDLARGY